MSKIFLLDTLVILLSISFALTWKCGADAISIKPKEIDFDNSKLRSLKTASFTPLEIYYDYTTLDSQMYDSTAKHNIKNLLSEAKDLFKAIIQAKKLTEKLALGNSNCYDQVQISEQVKNPGVDAHIIIFPFLDFNMKGNVLAYASACLSIRNYRPVAGFVGFPTDALKFDVENWFSYYLSLIMHEITHVLVFSSNLFSNFVDHNDNLLTTAVTKKATINGATRTLITTPKVVQAARIHFGCPNLEGVEVENQGGSGTAGSHWEARIMLTDFMIGSTYDETTISDITLALFEDSGWYKTNYYTGGLFRFGKNQGCSFLNSKCIEKGKSQFKNEFCDEKNKDFCTSGRSSRGFCYIDETSSNLGGFLLADYCPVSRVATNKNKYLNWNCKYGDIASASNGEVMSETSLCYSLTPSSNQQRAICYPTKCKFDSKTYTVTVSGQEIECPFNGGTKTTLKGSIECPKFNEICTSEIQCYDIKSCIDNKATSIISEGYDHDQANVIGLNLLLIVYMIFII